MSGRAEVCTGSCVDDESPIVLKVTRVEDPKWSMDLTNTTPRSMEIVSGSGGEGSGRRSEGGEGAGRGEDETEEQCSICQETIGTQGGLAIMPCPKGKAYETFRKKHQFCLDCIKGWAGLSESCPLCKAHFSRNEIMYGAVMMCECWIHQFASAVCHGKNALCSHLYSY